MSARRLSSLAILAFGAGCLHRAAAPAPPTVSVTRPAATLPDLPSAQLAPPVASSSPSAAAAPDTAREPHVDIDTHGRDEDVRPLLEFVGRAGGYRLSIAPGVDRRVRVELNDVPASVALTALLRAADLTLESTSPGEQPAAGRPVVFYELPMNVDSLSAAAIVKRFGVSPAVADMIVTSRGKP